MNPVSCARANPSPRWWRLPVVLIAVILLASAASAQTNIYHIRGNTSAGSNNLWSIDPTTGVETLVYSNYPGGNAATLAQRPSDGMIFYAINAAGGSNGAVYSFNPATPGVAPVLLGTLGAAVGSGYRMAFLGNTLYFMPGGGGADNDRLYTVSQTTGLATAGPNITGTGNGGDMTFLGNTLYIINQNRQLYSASTAGGAATLVGTVTFPGGITPGTLGIAVDFAGRLLIQTQNPSNLYRVTLPSLAASLFGAVGGGTTSTGDLASAAVPPPNLSITKTDGVSTVYRGGSVTYTIVVTNNGTYSVTGTVTDTVPASVTGVTWTCVASAGSFCAAASGSGNTISTSATLEAGDTATYTVSGTISATAAGTLLNTANVAVPSWFTDSNTANNTASDSDAINLNANLGITKTDGLASVNPGAAVTYTIVVSNAGPDASNGSVVTDTVPASLTGVTWTCGSPTGGATCGAANGSGNSISTTANLPAASSVTYTVSGTLASSATGTLSNTASVLTPSSGVTDPTDLGRTGAGNNSATDTTTINLVSDVRLTKTHTGNFTVGVNGTYTLTASNAGTASTSGTITITDNLPTGLTVASLPTGTGWNCSTTVVGSSTATCTSVTVITAGATSPNPITLTVAVSAAAFAASPVTNVANISGGGEPASNNGNNSVSDVTIINGAPDLVIAKTHTGNFTRGTTGIYTITVSNSGTANTSGTITVTDTLPAGLTVASTPAGTGWNCSATVVGSGTATCTSVTVIAAGAASPNPISLTVSVAQNAASSLTNNVSVSGGNQNNTANDTASDVTTIVSRSDLSLTKVATSSGNGVGTNATFTITLTNSGPSDATNVAVRDQLPAGLTYISSTPSVGTYNSGTGIWTLPSVTNGLSPTLQIVARIDVLGSLLNTAQVTASDQPDPDSTPNNSNAAEDDQASANLSTSAPDVRLVKSVSPNGTAPPGTDLVYTIDFDNRGGSYASNFVITDPVPQYTDFKVGSITTNPGSTGLSVTIWYSYDGGTNFVSTLPGGGGGGAPAGYNRLVTHVRWQFTGNLSQIPPNNAGSVSFTVRIQ
jgi:uncharacterized repeat protein (TIGR01451 family)